MLSNYKKVEELSSVAWFFEIMSTIGLNIVHTIGNYTRMYSGTSKSDTL